LLFSRLKVSIYQELSLLFVHVVLFQDLTIPFQIFEKYIQFERNIASISANFCLGCWLPKLLNTLQNLILLKKTYFPFFEPC
jgi:hypothetical protein